MRRVVMISENDKLYSEIKKHVSTLVRVKSAGKCIELLGNDTDTDAVIIENPSGRRNIRRLINYISSLNNYIFSVAILIITDAQRKERDIKFLGGAVVDCIEQPFIPEVLVNRLGNAIQLVSSVSFSEFSRMLKVLPANIYLKDAQGRYVFSSQTWHHLETGGDPDWSIKGKTDLDIRKDRENALRAAESDRKLIQSGVGTSYVIEENDEGKEFLQIIKEPLFFEDGRVRGIIALINNVTEQELLRRELKERSIRDTMTGCYNRSYIDEYLSGLGSEDYPLCILSTDCDCLKYINNTFGHTIGDEYIRMCVTLMRCTLPESSGIFRMGGDEFMALVPQTTADSAKSIIARMKRGAALYSINGNALKVSFGFGIAQKRGSIDEQIKLSDSRMYDDKRRNKRAAVYSERN